MNKTGAFHCYRSLKGSSLVQLEVKIEITVHPSRVSAMILTKRKKLL
jgi:hypothetical protein